MITTEIVGDNTYYMISAFVSFGITTLYPLV